MSFDLRNEIGKIVEAEQAQGIGGNCLLVDAIGFKRSYHNPYMPDSGRPPREVIFPIRNRRNVFSEAGHWMEPDRQKYRVYRFEGYEKGGQQRPIYHEVVE